MKLKASSKPLAIDEKFTTMKSSLAPTTRTLIEDSGTEGTGRDAFSFLRSNNGSLEL